MTFRICPDCGGRLDPGEKCNCREEEKEEFVKILQMLLIKADVNVKSLELTDEETVKMTFLNGYSKRINIAADSRLAIIKDVVNNIT